MRTLTVSLVILILSATGYGASLQKEYSFDSVGITQSAEYHQVWIDGLRSYGDPGNPVLPVMGRSLVLPPGEELMEVLITNEVWTTVAIGITPEPAARPLPLSAGRRAEVQPDLSVYNGNELHPASVISDIQTGFLRGYGIGSYVLHPVRWNPETGTIEQLIHVELELVTQPTPRATEALRFLRADRYTMNMLDRVNADPEEISKYSSELDELDEEDPSILIICPFIHQNDWGVYADFKRMRGQETLVMNTFVIYDEFEGDDNAEKVRNAIIDAYMDYGIQHVILAGDVEYVPYRGMYNLSFYGGEEDYNIPSDIYFAGLDGNWNSDGDNRWGEANEADLFQEVTVGRAPVQNSEQIATWIDKQIMYQDYPVAIEMTSAMMVGEDLGWVSWGGEYKDEVRYGSGAYGYTTEGFPNYWAVTTLYDMNSYWSVPQLFNNLNSGVHFVNHLGHCNVTYALKAVNPDITDANLTNDGVTHSRYLLYTQGCYCGAFEQACIMEKWNRIDNGAFAVISNSRYGWGSGANTDGASQHYDREFFDAMFDESIYLLGDVNRDSKHDCIPYVNESCMRWCFYQINLFGDPSIDLYTDIPQELEVELPDVYTLGNTVITISTPGESWIRVVIIRDDEVLAIGYTDANGNANIPLIVEEPGNLTVNIYAHNYFPYSGIVPVINADGPYPTVREYTIDDQATGNGNGQADYGEDVLLEMEVVNLGLESLESMDVSFQSQSSALTINGDVITVEDLEANESVILDCPAHVSVNVVDGTQAQVLVQFVSGEDYWERMVSIGMHAPNLSVSVIKANDEESGNGNHRLDPGETTSMAVWIENDGSSDLDGAQLDVYTDNPYLADIDIPLENIDVASGHFTELGTAFTVTVLEDAPDPYRAALVLRVQREDGYQKNAIDLLDIGGFFDDAEGLPQDITHYGNEGGGDQWHISADRNWTAYGFYSWKAGGEGPGSTYDDELDACLELPPVPREVPVTISFRHWMEAEISVQHGGECYDGGRVEFSFNGTNWMSVPMSGYNFMTRGVGGFGAGQSVYSGNIEWEEQSHTFPPSGDGELYIRFRFCTDLGTRLEGWYLDNISVALGINEEAPHSLTGEVTETEAAHLTWMTPDSELDEDFELLGFQVYRDGAVVSGIVPDVTYDDPLVDLPEGPYTYHVTAVYTIGESSPSNVVLIEWDGSSVAESESLPLSWSLDPPYPNPFNPTTTVSVAIPQASEVKLAVYDLLGREVVRLASGRLATGIHQFEVDAGQWSSGMYFVVFNTPSSNFVRKMVLIK